LLFLGAVLIGAAIYMQNISTFALHVRDAGFSNAAYGGLEALNGVIVVVLELPMLLTGLAFASLTFASTVLALIAMVFVWTIGEIVASPVMSAFVADRSAEHTRGRYQAVLGAMFALGGIIGPVLGTAVYAADPDVLWIGCGVAGFVAAGLALAAGRYPATVVSVAGGDAAAT
jgi:hypothetical protein